MTARAGKPALGSVHQGTIGLLYTQRLHVAEDQLQRALNYIPTLGSMHIPKGSNVAPFWVIC